MQMFAQSSETNGSDSNLQQVEFLYEDVNSVSFSFHSFLLSSFFFLLALFDVKSETRLLLISLIFGLDW